MMIRCTGSGSTRAVRRLIRDSWFLPAPCPDSEGTGVDAYGICAALWALWEVLFPLIESWEFFQLLYAITDVPIMWGGGLFLHALFVPSLRMLASTDDTGMDGIEPNRTGVLLYGQNEGRNSCEDLKRSSIGFRIPEFLRRMSLRGRRFSNPTEFGRPYREREDGSRKSSRKTSSLKSVCIRCGWSASFFLTLAVRYACSFVLFIFRRTEAFRRSDIIRSNDCFRRFRAKARIRRNLPLVSELVNFTARWNAWAGFDNGSNVGIE